MEMQLVTMKLSEIRPYERNPRRNDRVASTAVSSGSHFRMCDGLLLSDRDYINIQTFPQDYDFMGESVQYVCGMSVPPVMMAHIAGEIERQWFGRG